MMVMDGWMDDDDIDDDGIWGWGTGLTKLTLAPFWLIGFIIFVAKLGL
jgi:hypothetical protein